MQALYDFLPVLAFFVTFAVGGIYPATAVLIVASIAVAVHQRLRTGSISPMLMVSTALALVFGGLTLFFHNAIFIMWKPTIVYLLFAAGLVLSQFMGPKPFIQQLLEKQLRAPAAVWRTANLSWALFFLVIAAVNLVFVYRFSETAWVRWKLATTAIVFVFALAQGAWLARHAEAVEATP